MQTKNTKQGGFTLVEIAIVLVIIGLLLGGILKGQELINNAKVRSVADRQNSLKAAWFGFIDRYNFIPGDSKRAVQLVPGAQSRNDSSGAGDGRLSLGESVLAMQNLTGAGFLRCPQCNGGIDSVNTTNVAANLRVTAENSLINQYSGVMSIWNESGYYSAPTPSADVPTSGRLQIHSGPRIPSNILSEVDRKIDDGVANSGDMVFNGFNPVGVDAGSIDNVPAYTPGGNATLNEPDDGECINAITNDGTPVEVEFREADVEALWRTANRDGGAVESNCAASIFI